MRYVHRCVLDVLDDRAIADVTETDYGIYRTPEGELYNDEMLAGMCWAIPTCPARGVQGRSTGVSGYHRSGTIRDRDMS
jgi:hypothetical protein